MNANLQLDQVVESAYAVHAGPLLRRLTASTRDAAAAEDLMQEAFIRLMIEVRAGRAPHDVGAWLNRVGQNLASSRGRRLSVADRRRGDVERPGLAQSPEAATLQAEDDRSLRAALAELGAVDRRALILSAYGYRGPEIAKSIGRTDAATRTLLCRARTKLRHRLIGAYGL